MRFYFNMDYNKCMDEDSLVEFIQDIIEEKDEYVCEENIREELHTRREFCGWYECEVADAIQEKFSETT